MTRDQARVQLVESELHRADTKLGCADRPSRGVLQRFGRLRKRILCDGRHQQDRKNCLHAIHGHVPCASSVSQVMSTWLQDMSSRSITLERMGRALERSGYFE